MDFYGDRRANLDDDLQLYTEAAQRLEAVPIGQARIDEVVAKLARDGKLRPFPSREWAVLYARQRILSSWWAARSATLHRPRRAPTSVDTPVKAAARLRKLLAALDAFGHERTISALDVEAALDDRNGAAADELWDRIVALRAAASCAEEALRKVARKRDRRGRPRKLSSAFVHRLGKVWIDITGSFPSVTHDWQDSRRTGPFVDFVEAARSTVNDPELAGNMSVAAEKTARGLKSNAARQPRK